MNDIPTLVVKDDADFDELGKENGTFHKFLCAFRNAGGTLEDLRTLTKGSDSVDLGRVIARLHGVDPDDEWSIFMNLSAAPNLPGEIGEVKKIVDKRLGFWSVRFNDPDGLILGDQVVRIVPVDDCCISESRPEWYTRTAVQLLEHPNAPCRIDLNAQAAEAIGGKWDVAQGIFEKLQGDDLNWLEQYIYFLGTVWTQRKPDGSSGIYAKTGIYAKALCCSTKGVISVCDKLIPVGTWPKNCFAAVLEPYDPNK